MKEHYIPPKLNICAFAPSQRLAFLGNIMKLDTTQHLLDTSGESVVSKPGDVFMPIG